MKTKKRKTGIEIPKLESFVPMPSIKPVKETEIKDLYSHIDDMIIKDLEAKEACKQVAACLRVFQKHGIKVSDAFEIMFELSAILKEEKGGQ